MISCENSSINGGILADEMGLRKTIQILSLILTVGKEGDVNLVITPVVAINQWRQEIIKHMCVNILYKNDHNIDNDKINTILCSYGKVENLYRKKNKECITNRQH